MIVPPKNENRLYQAMKVMLTSSADREKLAGNARPMIEERFDSRYVRQCLYEFYGEVMKR